MAQNSAPVGAGINHEYNAGQATLRATIVANNSGGDCGGAIVSNGYNLDSDKTCSLTKSTDLPGRDPLLGSLQDNEARLPPRLCRLGVRQSMQAAHRQPDACRMTSVTTCARVMGLRAISEPLRTDRRLLPLRGDEYPLEFAVRNWCLGLAHGAVMRFSRCTCVERDNDFADVQSALAG
jgi:hypothetical protein